MNHLEVLARLIADLYQQIAELNARLEAKDVEMDQLAQTLQGQSPNRVAEEQGIEESRGATGGK